MNSFDHPLGETRYDEYLPQDVLPALDAARADAAARLDLVASGDEPLVTFGEATAAYEFIVATADGLAAVLGGAWHGVSRAANHRAARFRAAVHQRRDLYEAIRAVEPAGPVEERLRADLLRRFEHDGAHLDPAGRDRLAAINARLAELAADFMANLQAADAASGVATNDPAGLPDALVEAARAAAAARGLDGWYVPYSDANAMIVLRRAESRQLRAAMYRLTVARAAESNGPVVAEILALRQELAELHLARIWCDWCVRDGKRPGGWMTGPWLATDGGPHTLTVVTNIPRAGAGISDLRIMWHEFGHAMHFAFTRTRYRYRLRSPDDGPLDFIEGPSRLMENWPQDPRILRRMGVDERTAAAVRAEDRFRTASRKLIRLARPALDLALHRGASSAAT